MLPNKQVQADVIKEKVTNIITAVNNQIKRKIQGNSKKAKILKLKSDLLQECLNKIKTVEDPRIIKRIFGIATAVILQKKGKVGNTTSEGDLLKDLLKKDKILSDKYFGDQGDQHVSYRELRKFAKLQLDNQDEKNVIVTDKEHSSLEQFFSYDKIAYLQPGAWYQELLDGLAPAKQSEKKPAVPNSNAGITKHLQEVKDATGLTPPGEVIVPSFTELPRPPQILEASGKEDVSKKEKISKQLEQQVVTKAGVIENKVIPDTKEQKAEKVYYLSLDFDSCFAWNLKPKMPGWWGNPKTDKNKANNIERIQWIKDNEEELIKNILKGNADLFKQVAKEMITGGFTKLCMNVGTNRQDPYRDYWNMLLHGSPSFVPVLEAAKKPLAEAIKAELAAQKSQQTITLEYDRRLIVSTTTSTRQPGDTMLSTPGPSVSDKGVSAIVDLMSQTAEYIVNNAREGIMSLFDKSKITLLYQQMHRARELNPGQTEFHFRDDSYANILVPLQKFFKDNPDLIPKDMTLHIHHYMHGVTYDQSDLKPIEGTGVADPHYKETMLLVGAAAFSVPDSEISKVIAPLNESKCEQKDVVNVITEVKPYVDQLAKEGSAIALNGHNEGNDGCFDAKLFRAAQKLTGLLPNPKVDHKTSPARSMFFVTSKGVQLPQQAVVSPQRNRTHS